MIEEGIVAAMDASTELAALVGTNIYPVALPAGTTAAAVTFQVVASSPNLSIDGALQSVKRVQFDAWSPSYLTGKQIQKVLKNLFCGFVGTLPDGTVVSATLPGQEFDEYENDSQTYRSLAEYTFHFVE
jgi:hypothetical protein